VVKKTDIIKIPNRLMQAWIYWRQCTHIRSYLW